MTNKTTNQSWAFILIALGLLFLATNFGWFGWLSSWLWSLLFLGAGTVFLYVYYQNREHWWALIPGFALIAVGVASLSGNAAGGLFLGLVGLGFAAVYITNRKHWWAIIPAGALFTLALIAWLNSIWPARDIGWIFFSGLAATFLVLFFLPEQQGKQRWAMYPALGALALGVMTFLSSNVGSVAISLVLIAVGVYLFWRKKDPQSLEADIRADDTGGSPQPH